MFRKSFIAIGLLLSGAFLSGCTLNLKKLPAALQIDTTPASNVFMDGKLLGKTPYSAENLKAGEVTVKLIPESATESLSSWEGKVKLNNGILTLVNREFAVSESNSSSYILSLEKVKDKNSALISVVTEPDGVLIKVDEETKGFAPLSLDKIAPGDHEIILSKENYKDKRLRVKNVLGYRLLINAKLGQEELQATPTPEVSVSPGPTKKAQKPTTTVTPKVTPKEVAKPYVLIKETETGFLRVRADAKTSSAELAKVKPGEKYSFVESSTDGNWYKIIYTADKEGWVSAKYAEKVE